MSLLLMLVAVGGAAADGIRVGSEAEVIADDGANLRQGPSAAAGIVALVGQARYVFVEAGPEGGWYKVEYDGDVGWVHGSLLGPARPRTTSRGDAVGRGSDERPPSGAPAGVRVGAEAEVATADGVNLRREPSTAAAVIELVKNARIVYVLDGPKRTDEGLWYRVEFDGSVGWMMGSYLGRRGQGATESEAPAPAQAGSAPRPARSRGEAIAQRALGLVGSPYAWGGSSPRTGFDCSGLIAYVMGQFGLFPGRTADAQAGAGMSVTGGDLLPGDIVVFANTYARGYSHTGLYVGGGRFVHAEDYGTGVVVSPVFGGYWGRHYAGARRAW